jgi:hypothetical protein
VSTELLKLFEPFAIFTLNEKSRQSSAVILVVPNLSTLFAREFDRFTNPCGFPARVAVGVGASWQVTTPEKPVPAERVTGVYVTARHVTVRSAERMARLVSVTGYPRVFHVSNLTNE